MRPSSPALVTPTLVTTVPTDRTLLTLLYATRRMAAHGLDDAHAANALFGRFGVHSRQIGLYLRTVMWELSRTSRQSITIAPCCCRRMTQSEDLILSAIIAAPANPAVAADALFMLTGNDAIAAPQMAMEALATALHNHGYWPGMTR